MKPSSYGGSVTIASTEASGRVISTWWTQSWLNSASVGSVADPGAYSTVTGATAPLDRANVDTDQIMPKEFLKRMLQAGGDLDVVKGYKYKYGVADDQLYWPFEGEYWRDELGTYEYTLTWGCRKQVE